LCFALFSIEQFHQQQREEEEEKQGGLPPWLDAQQKRLLKAQLWEMRAQAENELGRSWAAVRAAEQAVLLVPHWAVGWWTLARAQRNVGELGLALRNIRLAQSLMRRVDLTLNEFQDPEPGPTSSFAEISEGMGTEPSRTTTPMVATPDAEPDQEDVEVDLNDLVRQSEEMELAAVQALRPMSNQLPRIHLSQNEANEMLRLLDEEEIPELKRLLREYREQQAIARAQEEEELVNGIQLQGIRPMIVDQLDNK
jgi:hypothetical protein